MADAPDHPNRGRRKQRDWVPAADWVDESEPKLSAAEQQAIAHSRDRICKQRDCAECAPLRERRRLKKAQRKADAQAEAHANGQPCSRTSCELAACVADRNTPATVPTGAVASEPGAIAASGQKAPDDPAQASAREAKRHKVGLPCGSEDCPRQECIDGFANERTRRHRARRPCRMTTCDNPVCVDGRSANRRPGS